MYVILNVSFFNVRYYFSSSTVVAEAAFGRVADVFFGVKLWQYMMYIRQMLLTACFKSGSTMKRRRLNKTQQLASL